jgi:hypothetical protein
MEEQQDLRVEYNGKFYIASKLDNQITGVDYKHTNTGRKTCVVYAIWSAHWYLKYLKYSVLSQLANTDFREKCDIKIFVDVDLQEYARWMFRDILDESCIVLCYGWYPLKYTITSHPDLAGYENICFCDSDAFFLPGSSDFYQRLEKSLSDNPKRILGVTEWALAERVFWSRHQALGKNIPAEEYKQFYATNIGCQVEDLDNFLLKDNWRLSCVFAYNAKHCYSEPSYSKLALTSLSKFILCDETVWLMWASANKYEIGDIREIGVLWRNRTDEIDSSPLPQIVHPLAGVEILNENIIPYLLDIEKRAQSI